MRMRDKGSSAGHTCVRRGSRFPNNEIVIRHEDFRVHSPVASIHIYMCGIKYVNANGGSSAGYAAVVKSARIGQLQSGILSKQREERERAPARLYTSKIFSFARPIHPTRSPLVAVQVYSLATFAVTCFLYPMLLDTRVYIYTENLGTN